MNRYSSLGGSPVAAGDSPVSPVFVPSAVILVWLGAPTSSESRPLPLLRFPDDTHSNLFCSLERLPQGDFRNRYLAKGWAGSEISRHFGLEKCS